MTNIWFDSFVYGLEHPFPGLFFFDETIDFIFNENTL